MTVKSTQEVGERGRRNGDGPRFGLWTGHHHSRSAAPVDDGAGGSCTAARQATHPMPVCSSGARPAAACWAARSDVGGPSKCGVGRRRRARGAARAQDAAASGCFAAGGRLHLLAHRGGTTASATAVLDHRNLRRRNAKPRRRAACGWCVKLGFQKGAVVRVQQRSAGKPTARAYRPVEARNIRAQTASVGSGLQEASSSSQ